MNNDLSTSISADEFAKELQTFGVTDDILDAAIAAANKVLADRGAKALVEELGIAHATREVMLSGCKCKEWQTVCYPIKECRRGPDGLICEVKQKCYRKCVRWDCGPV